MSAIRYCAVIITILLSIYYIDSTKYTDVFGQTAPVLQTSSIEEKIKKYEDKLDDLDNKADSLSKELEVIENNINLKSLQIERSNKLLEEKELELQKLEGEIDLLENRLDRIGENIGIQKDLVDQRIRRQYIQSQKPFIEKLLDSKGIGDFLTRLKYIQLIQKEDQILIDKMELVKDNYEDQQTLLEMKKLEVEKVKKEIEAQKLETERLKNALEDQRTAKDDLLELTKNDEKKYQSLLAEAKKELEQAQNALNVVIKRGESLEVKKGESIGTMGNTGWSTGPHLHFGVYKLSENDFKSSGAWGWYNQNSRNPLDYLKPKTLAGKTMGSGKWDWPMKDPIVLTQGYRVSRNPKHPALDLVGKVDKTIRTPDKGKAYFCRGCLNDGGNWAFIFHDGGIMTVYAHMR